MPIIRFVTTYDGRPFEGWQSQSSGRTVQDRIEWAFQSLLKQPIRIHGSGRTDAGVHAVGQVFHVEFDRMPSIPPDKWPAALNTRLAHSIRILKADHVPDDFHARFSARGKLYRYTISRSGILSPFDHGLVWHNSRPVDTGLMYEAMQLIEGTHDFKAFASLRGNEPDPIPSEYFVRTIYESTLACEGELIRLTFHGNGFLYKMVRMLAGAVHTVGTGGLSLDDFRLMLARPGSRKSPYCAPAEGLYLVSVMY